MIMSTRHRRRHVRVDIIKSIIAEHNPASLANYNLTPSEDVSYRRHAARLLKQAGDATSAFSSYRFFKRGNPFFPIAIAVGLIVTLCVIAAAMLCAHMSFKDATTYPLIAAAVATIAVAVTAIGWGVGSWVAHRNAKVQHTINLLFARVLQPTFAENVARFNKHFGHDMNSHITSNVMNNLSQSDIDTDQAAAQTVKYMLNYFEFISAGIVRGDIDYAIVVNTMKSQLIFYYDKCHPFIRDAQKINPEALEHYSNLRDHLRELP